MNSKRIGGTLFSNITNIGDPFVFYEDGYYYMFGTGYRGEAFSCYIGRSLDQFNENPVIILKKEDSFGVADFWAPEIIKYNNEYFMFYSAKGNDGILHIQVAKSQKITGPYIDININKPLLPWASIDASPFIDKSGKIYLLFVMDCSKNVIDGVHTSQTYIIELDESLSNTIGEPKLLLTPDVSWEYDKNDAYRWNEGPSMIYHDGYYFITYSTHHFMNPNYSIGLAKSKEILGPYIKDERGPILKRITGVTSGTGHNSFFYNENKELMTAYHVHTDVNHPSANRRACFSKILFNNNELIIDYK